jgi:hypothetical protein
MSPDSDSDRQIQALAVCAALKLSPEQRNIVAPILQAWQEGSLALNEIMSQVQHAAVVPITVLRHTEPRS